MELICPRCMSAEVIRLDLADGDTLTCHGCDKEYTVSDVRLMLDSWSRLLPWLEAHPARRSAAAAAAAG